MLNVCVCMLSNLNCSPRYVKRFITHFIITELAGRPDVVLSNQSDAFAVGSRGHSVHL